MSSDLFSFWTGKNVLITGHTGFKGSWLTVLLHYLGAEVHGISREKKEGIYTKANISSLCKTEYFLDISKKNKEDIDKIIAIINPEIVFHFAAQSLVIKSYEDPSDTVYSNIIGTFNILESANLNNSIKTLVIATTDKVYKYPNAENKEDSELGGQDFYSSTKVSAELLIRSYINSQKRNGLSISVIRSGNVIGGGDRAENRLITDLVKSLTESKDFTLRMPKSIRPWQYVLDSLVGYIMVAESSYKNNESEIYNLNSELNNKYNSQQISQIMFDTWKPNKNKVQILQNTEIEYKEVDILKINSKKAKKKLNWYAKYNIQKIIEEIVSWEKHHIENNGPEFSISQVEEFLTAK
jgi:CDP-glucose 4,6-dehydratase